MVRRCAPAVVCLSVLLFAIQLTTATPTLHVNESKIRLLLDDKQSRVSLELDNTTGRSFNASFLIELLDPKDSVRASVTTGALVQRGKSAVVVPVLLPYSELRETERREFPLYRLRYRVTPEASAGEVSAAEGVVSISEVTPDLFELRVVSSKTVRPGTQYRARVRAANPATQRGVRDVAVEAVMTFDEDEPIVLKASGATDADGYARLEFTLPRKIVDDDEPDLKVTARRGGIVQVAEEEIDSDLRPRALLTTDKSLYQPGQTLHARALVFDGAERALPDAEVILKIVDEEGNDAFRTTTKTSRFGVASADWQIPASTRLGQYLVRVESEDEEYFQGEPATGVKISRYDLPNFAVSTKNDRPFYLKGQHAEIEVRADYLFGQPVKRGRARVVRQVERVWNYKEQKYETQEETPVEGELDAEGRFVARLDLTKEHKELAESGWRRFEDIRLAAYVTDPTTNRTEQRRFSLRVTRDPIHVYVFGGRFEQAAGLPLAFYVSTFYADGEPAQCEVSVVAEGAKRLVHRPGLPPHEDQDPDRTVLKLKTNRYGVAKGIGPAVSREEGRRNLSLHFVARDGEGRVGRHDDDFWLRDEERPELRVETDKTIYREGEPVAVEVTANRPRLSVVVDASVEDRVVTSRTLRLSGGRASFVLPYHPEFKGRLAISAVTTEVPPDRYHKYSVGTRRIVYPRNRELKLEARMTQASYKPGEEAGVEFAVRAPGGRRVESALGVVVFDKAVEERARTEHEFGSAWGFGGSFYSYWYGPDEIAGINRRQIEQLDLSGTPPAALDEVAELLLNSDSGSYAPNVFGSTEFETDQAAVFKGLISAQLNPLTAALNAHYERHAEYPLDDDALSRILSAAGVSVGELRDPWGSPYRARFSTDRAEDVLELLSAGADERADTDDDFAGARLTWPYFRPAGEKINHVAVEYHKRTGGFIRDRQTLAAELRRVGLELDSLRDRWGQPYKLDFGVSATYYFISVESAGPNKVFEEGTNYSGDDFTLWTSITDYFTEARSRVDSALDAHLRAGHGFPQTERALREALRRSGVTPEELRDGWGRGVYATFGNQKFYADRVKVESAGRPDARGAAQRTTVEPVTRTVSRVELRSKGADAKTGTADDFTIGYFTSVAGEQSADNLAAVAALPLTTFSGGTGAITGTVIDPIGAVISGATVTATHKPTGLKHAATTDDEGKYLLRNLPSGIYTVRFDAPGFMATTIVDVRVQSSNLTRADATLEVGTMAETVSVTASDSSSINASSSRVETNVKRGGAVLVGPQVSTPRLREFFPETLVWNPELTTDTAGRARLDFKLADNITTWKMSVIASTEDGQLGTFEQEFRAFQPFFVEHDPPRVLTEGDEISLPVVLRNYLERAQGVDVEIKPEAWFALTGPARRRAEVPSGDAARPTFDFRAVASVLEGKQRITAYGTDASDAIEKPVTVHPDGEERSQTSAAVFGGAGALDVNVPADIINGSLRAELKIYPNLAAHVFEGVEGIMRRPYGCGEQTISSAYPSVLVLNHAGAGGGGNQQQVVRLARRYAREGYERLLNYRAAGGGFTYWGRGEPDLALTAYALRFLTDAGRVIEVDEAVVKETLAWLVRQQRADGSWPAYEWGGKDDTRRTALTTAYIARVMARTGKSAFTTETPAPKPSTPNGASKPTGETLTPLARALRYLSTRVEEADEPYLLASYALAWLDAGERAGARRAVEKLRALALDEGAGTYWSLESNTPFYGWGLAGRVETTALVVQALAHYERGEKATPSSSAQTQTQTPGGTRDTGTLINRGLLFLLHKKDRYGVWYSTQATVNVLDTLLSLVADDKEGNGGGNQGAASSSTAEVIVNNRRAGEVSLPPAGQLSAPLFFDLSPFVAPGDNRVEIRRAGQAAQAQAQAVATYYVPWSKASEHAQKTTGGGASKRKGASALRLNVSFDRASAEVGQEITCRVEAERVGFGGYGMLLAEVGLPPGADVDRASLERTMNESGWSISSYDVLPDRLVIYLWPHGGGIKFDFKFRPRFGLNAQSAPSQLYDYYNPEARTVVAPSRFVVR
ncbi:MAG TPA: alpha-2-macroglobulin family protein [Pyrinomonadaceae bacterium]|nr:alpha-2-macroglobulin family protein [Pyrinomonadaceae bacterium]